MTADEPYRGYTEVLFTDDTPVPKPTDEDEKRGFIFFVRSTVDKVYRETVPKVEEIRDSASIFLAKDEYEPIQIGIYPLKDLGEVKFSATDLVDSSGNRIKADNIDIKVVRYLGQQVGVEYFKYFRIIPKTIEKMESIDINKGVTRAFWVTIKATLDAKPGKYQTDIKFTSAISKASVFKLEVDVLPFEIKSNPKILYAVAMTYEFHGLYDTKDKKGIDKIWELAEKTLWI